MNCYYNFNDMESDSQFWNILDLPSPVILSKTLTCYDGYKVVAQMKSVVNKIMSTLNDLNHLNIEAATLSRLIYRTKHKLRQEKSFKNLQKINRCLTNYKTMHLPFTIATLRDSLVAPCGPTKQMLECALVRLVGAAHLFNRVYSLCIDAVGHLMVKIKLAHMWEVNFFSVATVSRIWTISQFIVNNLCEWYKLLYQFLDKLEPSPIPWLPDNHILPEDLTHTLGNPEYLTLKSVPKPSKLLSQVNNVTIPDSIKTQFVTNVSSSMDVDMFDDIGECVSRNIEKENSAARLSKAHISGTSPNHPSKKKKQEKLKNTNINKSANILSKQYVHSINSIQSSKDLKTFIQVESSIQNKQKKGSNLVPVLKNVDRMQCLIIQKYIYKQIKIIKQSEESGNTKHQRLLLKKIRKYIKKWVDA